MNGKTSENLTREQAIDALTAEGVTRHAAENITQRAQRNGYASFGHIDVHEDNGTWTVTVNPEFNGTAGGI